MSILSPKQWGEVDRSVKKALEYLADQQQADGSFPTPRRGQPGVTSLCVMAFLANGHLPGEGPYGEALERAIGYVHTQQKINGIIASSATEGPKIGRRYGHFTGKAVAYNHAISGLMLSEVYGMTGGANEEKAAAVRLAIKASQEMVRWPKTKAVDAGGWRYAHDDGFADSDLSLTGWELMFLRSAENAGFEIKKQVIDDAIAYVLRCYRPDYGTFNYYIWPKEDRRSRGMAGAGVLALAHAGRHQTKEAQTTGDWILEHDFQRYNRLEPFRQTGWFSDRYHYGIFYCSQAMYQLGGDHWRRFFPPAAQVLIENQNAQGAWQPEQGEDFGYGPAYTTALAALALSAPNQILPIFQR